MCLFFVAVLWPFCRSFSLVFWTDPSINDCLATPHIETQLDLSFQNLQRWMDWEDEKGNRSWGLHKGHMMELLRTRGESNWSLAEVGFPLFFL